MANVQTRPKSAPELKSPVGHEPADNARGRFMALAAALLGWMFDGAEMGI
jgi:hypothetical protein